jgi:hypothetical protein
MNQNNLKNFRKLSIEDINEFKGNKVRGISMGSCSINNNGNYNIKPNKFNFTTNTFYSPNSEVIIYLK